jgi:hypothetical protein
LVSAPPKLSTRSAYAHRTPQRTLIVCYVAVSRGNLFSAQNRYRSDVGSDKQKKSAAQTQSVLERIRNSKVGYSKLAHHSFSLPHGSASGGRPGCCRGNRVSYCFDGLFRDDGLALGCAILE